MLLNALRPAVVIFLFLTLLTGGLYPLVVTGVAKVCFPTQANGSIIEQGGKAVGSSLIAQGFDDPRYFWPRLSGCNYNAAASSGTNLGPTNPALMDNVAARVKQLKDAGHVPAGAIPVDLVTASGSGLDPHISPEAAEYQVERVAAVRGIPAEKVRAAVAANTEGRTLGVLGEPRVNVLGLNLTLDAAK